MLDICRNAITNERVVFKLFNLENIRSLFLKFSNSPNKSTIIDEILSKDCIDVNGTRNDIRNA